MSAFCFNIIKVLKIINNWANDACPEIADRRWWAKNGLRTMQGKGGFIKLVKIGIDTDYAYLCHRRVMVQDKSSNDVALHDWECDRYLHATKALLEEGRIFEADCHGTFTWAILTAIQQEPDWFFPDSETPSTWPRIPKEAM